MSVIQIILILCAALTIAFLLLRVRVRLEIKGDQRRLFIGLGRTGSDLDLRAGRGRVKMLGIPIRTFRLERGPGPQLRKLSDWAMESEHTARAGRHWSWSDLWETLPRLGRATWDYLGGVFSDMIIEEAEGELRAGFDQPDLTGQAYGFYHVVKASVPGLAGRFSYVPDWSGASFGGSLRLAVAWPVYRLLYRTGVWLIKIRVVKIIRWAIGTKEGGRDVQ